MNKSEYKQKKSHKGLIAVIILLLIAGGVGAGCYYLDQNFKKATTLPSGASVNGIDVSRMTPEKAESVLTKEWNNHTLTINRDGEKVGEIKDLNFRYDIQDELKKEVNPSFIDGVLRMIDKKRLSYTIDMKPKAITKTFMRQFNALEPVKNGDGKTKTRDAYVDLSNTDFKIVKEVYGDNLDKEKFQKAILKAIAKGEDSLDYTPKDYYEQPKVKVGDEKLSDDKDYAETYLTKKITYDTPNGDYTILPRDLNKMMVVDDSGKIDVNAKAVKKFMSKLATECNDVGITRTLNLVGGKVTVSGGTYGSELNVKKEQEQLTEALKSTEDSNLKPIYATAAGDIGDDYVEISIGAQHVWCVSDGKTVVDTPVVTGNVSQGFATPTGLYYIVYKQPNATLEGENADGSKYKTKVSYWMPFYGGYGLHDANWRGAFGGSIYVSNGSHGCVNMPPASAAVLYGYVYSGMPVVVHN